MSLPNNFNPFLEILQNGDIYRTNNGPNNNVENDPNNNSGNPFLDDIFDTNQTNDNSSNSFILPQESPNIVGTNNLKSPTLDASLTNDMSDTRSPTAALEIPEWWGHSLDSPINKKATHDRWNEDLDPFDSASGPSSSSVYLTGNVDDKNNKKLKGPNDKRTQGAINASTTPKGLIDPPPKKNDMKFKKSKSMSPNRADKNDTSNDNEGLDNLHFSFNITDQSLSDNVEDNKKILNANSDNENINDTSTVNKTSSKTKSQPASPKNLIQQGLLNHEKSADLEDEKELLNKKNDIKTANVDTNNNDNNSKQIDKNNQNKEDISKNSQNKKNEFENKQRRPKTDAVAEMKRGATMLKYGRHGLPHFRRFQLSSDNTKLLWYSQKKRIQDTNITISDIRDILEGQQTEIFKQCSQRSLVKASFSIVHGSKLKTLDVVAKSHEEAQVWIKGLKGLLKARDHGKLQDVVQIFVDVNYTDMTKPRYRQTRNADSPNKNEHAQEYNAHPDLVELIDHTLKQSRKAFKEIEKIAQTETVQKSQEYDNISTLISEIEQRFEDLEFSLVHQTIELVELKRDVWAIKVDVQVLDEKLKVLAANKSFFGLF